MALIKCTECGQMVSERASQCPNCGCPVEKKIVCEECGGNVSPHDIVCPNCGCPLKVEETESKVMESPAEVKQKTNEVSDENSRKTQQFLVQNKKYLPGGRMEAIRSQLLGLNDSQWSSVEWVTFKDPMTMFIISFFVGPLGVDRFMLGDTSNGIFKLLLTLLCGVGLIWWLIDLFKINDMTLEYNHRLLSDAIGYS